MLNEDTKATQNAWINCRESFEASLELGEVVIPAVNIWERPGSPPKSGNVVVTKRANTSHRRHASPDAIDEVLSSDELGECFHKTANILAAFAGYLNSFISH